MNAVTPPGLRPARLAQLVERSVASMSLDLSGARVLTEAATGAYVVTPVLAAVAGAAQVDAVTRSTRYGSVEDVTAATLELASMFGVGDRISITDGGLDDALVGSADILTNSGHVRPIDARVASRMRPTAVVPLMFEAWEIDLGRDDVDLVALRRHGIRCAGTNERHPNVDVFSYLGPMAVKLLTDAAVSAYGGHVLVICDNPFATYLEDGLQRVGATVTMRDAFDVEDLDGSLDAVLVALKPRDEPVLSAADLRAIADHCPGAALAQYWGDIPRDWCSEAGVPCVPIDAPGAGHMGVLPSAVGPEPIVRLQAGGLKVGEILLRPESERTPSDREYLDEL